MNILLTAAQSSSYIPLMIITYDLLFYCKKSITIAIDLRIIQQVILFYQPADPLTFVSKHFFILCRSSPTNQAPRPLSSPSELKNGSTQHLAIEQNRSRRIHVSRGPVSSMAGSELISRSCTWNLGDSGTVLWCVTRKSTPKSSNAFGRGCGNDLD